MLIPVLTVMEHSAVFLERSLKIPSREARETLAIVLGHRNWEAAVKATQTHPLENGDTNVLAEQKTPNRIPYSHRPGAG